MNAKFITKTLYGLQSLISTCKTKIYSNCLNFKRQRIKSTQSIQSIQHRQAVLAAGDSDSDTITGIDHVIVIDRTAGLTQ